MKRRIKGLVCFALAISLLGLWSFRAQASEENGKAKRILPGIFIENISLEGKTAEEARAEVESYVSESLGGRVISLIAIDGNKVDITPAEIGLRWSNPEIVEEAADIGQTGNVVARYKAAKDLQYQNKVFHMEFDADREQIRQILEQQCAVYNVEAKDATLSRVNGSFVINEGQTGKIIDVEASTQLICDYFNSDWNEEEGGSIELIISVDEPQGTAEELGKVKDVLGTFTTSYRTSGSARSANVANGCALINGTTLYPGDEFSTCEAITPFTSENGYYMAASYLNGQVVDSLGGGICQVSTTLYNAVLLSELEVTERHNHSMIVTYVDPSADAAIAESSGKDFRFVNNTQAPLYIEGVTTDDKHITFTIYGVETRDSGHQVRYESEVVSTTYPDTEVIYVNESLPLGSISVQSAHIGYKANLWKIVTENGREVSREQVNSSSYKVTPRTATVGVATADPNAYNQIMAAIATNSIDHVKNVAAALAAGEVPPPTEVPIDPATGQPIGGGADPGAGQPIGGAVPADPAAAQPAAPAEQAPAEVPPAELPAE
ncbi:MAG: hypothetical protein HFI96_10455 [Lachnospiraceae bacterium]|jgi:vancomycin resistance protein YoaR|nr:hypothetical protein [Lachnospiraceae bacterium]MCI9095032.1 hypothetical protein [Lachnospiraceae bacterium]